jgi:peptide/nickel transport system permease protein
LRARPSVPPLETASIAIGITATPIVLRLARRASLAAKVGDYVEPARAMGNPRRRIAVRHILPTIVPPLLVRATPTIATGMIAGASLSFLGLGQRSAAPPCGAMLTAAQRLIERAAWMEVFPRLSIVSAVVGFTPLGEGLTDAVDPRGR